MKTRLQHFLKPLAMATASLACFINIGCNAGSNMPVVKKKPAPQVEVAEIKTSDMVQTIPLTGEVVAIEIAQISSNVDGSIGFSPFREGDKVEAGATLIEIDRETLRAELVAAEASLEVVKARLADITAGTRPEEIDKAFESVKQFKESMEFASKDLERIEMLVKSGAMATEELEKARVKSVSEQTKYNAAKRQLDMLKTGVTVTALAVQRASVKEAEARLNMAKARLAECTIKAPFGGVITKLFVNRGDMAAVKAPLIEICNFDSLVIRSSVPEKFASNLALDMMAEVTVDAINDRVFAARISRIFPDLDAKMRTRTIELTVVEPAELMPGMFARLKLIQQKLPGVLSLPVQAVLTKPDGSSFVFVPNEGKAAVCQIKTGQKIGNLIQITEGLKAGDKVIVAGNEKLKDGAEIRVAGAKPANPDAGAADKKKAAGGEQK